jgi:hypothetical protein
LKIAGFLPPFRLTVALNQHIFLSRTTRVKDFPILKVVNGKLSKEMKTFEHTVVIKLDSNRDLETKHGLHMNNKGKELSAKKIASTTKRMPNTKNKKQKNHSVLPGKIM